MWSAIALAAVRIERWLRRALYDFPRMFASLIFFTIHTRYYIQRKIELLAKHLDEGEGVPI
jgi:hypothetical protein